jgi:DNA-binding MarR family transcriptional regulator
MVRIAETIRKLRHVRREEFGLQLDEPAWDMLIELYCRDNVAASTTAALLQDAAHVPSSTAIRWIRHLQERGFVTVKPHPNNAETQFVEMTFSAKDALEQYLKRVLAAAGPQPRT